MRLFTEEEREVYCRDLADNWSGDADTDGKYEEVFSWSRSRKCFHKCTSCSYDGRSLILQRRNGDCAPRSLIQILMNYHLTALRPCLFVPLASFLAGLTD